MKNAEVRRICLIVGKGEQNEAIDIFRGMNENYKIEILREIPDDQVIALTLRAILSIYVAALLSGFHREDQGNQALEKLRRILARRRKQQNAEAHLWHKLPQQ